MSIATSADGSNGVRVTGSFTIKGETQSFSYDGKIHIHIAYYHEIMLYFILRQHLFCWVFFHFCVCYVHL